MTVKSVAHGAALQLGSVQEVRANGVDERGELLRAVADLLDMDAR